VNMVVRVFFSEKGKRHVRKYELVSSRILLVRMKIGILSVCSRHVMRQWMVLDDDTKQKFWNQMNDILNACDAGERVIVLGELNGWVGVKKER
jgi:hypothetical protein